MSSSTSETMAEVLCKRLTSYLDYSSPEDPWSKFKALVAALMFEVTVIRAFSGGPYGCVGNRLSASASEIFAGAVQDYGRGLVIGSQTFGKGTVQALLPVNEGQLKLTIAKFYRISGQSTQHQGVIPDIQFPSAFDPNEIGESALDTALPWDQIRSLRYRPIDSPQTRTSQLIDRHQARIAADPNFGGFNKAYKQALELRGEKVLPHLETRIKERETNKQKLLDIENTRRSDLGLPAIEV